MVSAKTSEAMATTTGARLLRDRHGPQRVTFLELFFDLVYVFAITQLSHGLLEHLDWSGAFQTLVLLQAVWIAWIYTAWITNWFDPGQLAVVLVIVAIMFASLVMSAALPEAFGERGLVFALAYVAIQLGRTVFCVVALRGHPLQRNFVRVLFWFGVSAVPWLVGAYADGAARGALWALAVVVELTVAFIGFATPGLGRSQTSEWTIAGEHLIERCNLFLILALGESILVAGATFADGAFELGRVVAFVVAFSGSVAMWWIYFYRTGELATAAIASSSDQGRVGRAYSYIFVVMVAGVIVTAVGDELVIAHPTGHTEPAWLAVILGGPALFVAGHALFKQVVFGYVPWSRPIALLALAAVAPALVAAPPLVVAITATGVLIGVAVSDTAHVRQFARRATARSR